jgi:hypothetical protein
MILFILDLLSQVAFGIWCQGVLLRRPGVAALAARSQGSRTGAPK